MGREMSFDVGELVDVGVGHGVIQAIALNDTSFSDYSYSFLIRFSHRLPRRFGGHQRNADRHERWFYLTYVKKVSLLVRIAWAAK